MPLLNIPYIPQTKDGWCLPACVAMVSAFWQKPLLQDDVALWLQATNAGVAASRVQRLTGHGWNVLYRTGSLQEIVGWLEKKTPCILFVRTGELPYWKIDTPHAVVIGAVDENTAIVFDPAMESSPFQVPVSTLLLAWSFLDYAYAVITPNP